MRYQNVAQDLGYILVHFNFQLMHPRGLKWTSKGPGVCLR